MSFRKYGGTNKLEKNNNITVHSIVADTFTIRDAFLSLFTIEGDLKIGGNGLITNNFNVNQQISAATLDISLNATIEGFLYLDKNNDVFLKGSNQMIGINKSTPTATLDISSNQVQAFNLKTSAANNRNIIARNLTNNGIAVTATGTTESGIQFYSANSGTIDISNAQGAMIKYSNTDSLLTLDSTGGDVKVLSKMIITDNTSNGNTHTSFGETVLIYDKDNGANQPVFFNDVYGNTNVNTGSAITVQSINNASNTFVNIGTPSKLGIQIGGGSYPKDPSRSMGIIDVYNPSITNEFNTDNDATPSIMIVSGNSVTKFNSTTGFNTFQPKYNNYAVDINGPLHLNNGEVKKTIETTMRITKLSNFGSSYGIAIGGQGEVDGTIRYFTYTTNNGGKSWTRKNALTSTDINSSIEFGDQIYKSVYSYSATRTIIGGTGSSLWVTDNGATNWYQLFITGGILTMNAIYTPPGISENFVYIGGDTGSGNATIRYGYIEPFTHIYTGLTGNPTATRYRYTDVSYNYPITDGIISDFSGFGQNFFVVGGNKIRKFDLGVSKMTLTLVSEYTNPGTVTYSAVRLADADNGVAVGGNVISYTKNGGTSWATANIPSLSGKTFNDVFLDGSMNAIVVGNNGYIYSSNDGYYTWKIVDEDVLNASGVGSRITDLTNNITSVFMPDSSTIILSIVKNNSNARAAKLYYLNMPNIFNNKQNFLFDVSGCIRMSGDLVFSEGGEIISKDSTFNFVTKNVATLNAATNALAINMGGTNTTNISIGGTNTVNLLAGGINTSNLIIGGNVTTSKIGPLNISALTTGNVILSNNLVTGNVYANSIVLTNNLDVNNGIVTIGSTNNSTSATTGSLVVYGGLGVAKDIYSSGNTYLLRDINLSGNLYSSGNTLIMTSNDDVSAFISGSSIIYTSNTGTLQIGGGTSISKNIYIGGTTFCGGNLVVKGQITYLGGNVSTSTTFSSAIAASPLKGNSNENIDYNYTYTPRVPPTNYNDIGFGAGALTTEGGFGVALDTWLIGNLRVDGINNLITSTIESVNITTGALQISGGVGIGMNVNIGGNVILNNTTESNSTVTGALQIRGGVGIGMNTNIGGNVIIHSSIESTSISTGALQIRGGVGIGGNVYTGGNVIINSIIESNSTVTGALQIKGGVGIGMNTNIGGNVIIHSSIESTSISTGALQIRGGVGIGGNVFTGGNVIINNTIESNNTVTGALQIRGGVGIGRNLYIGGNVIINSTIESTSTNTGALQIIGGVGIGGNVFTGGNVIINNTTESNSTVTGALQIRGGVGIGMNTNIGGNVIIHSSIESTSISTGALQIRGGVGIGGNVYTGGNVIINSTIESNSTVTGAFQIRGGVGIGGNLYTGGNVIINNTSQSTSTVTGALQIRGGVGIGMNAHIGGNVIIHNSIESTSISTGALQIRGGVGIGGNVYTGGNVIINSTIESNSTVTGAFQIRGGVGIGGNTNIGGNVNIGKKTIVLDTTDSGSSDTGAFQVRGGMGVANKIVSGSLSTGIIGATNLTVTSSEVSENTFSGALQVRGGMGVGGSIYAGGSIYTTEISTSGQGFFNSTNDTITTGQGAVVTAGGIGVAKNAIIGGNVIINSTTESNTTITGALQIRGGVGIGRNLNVGGGTTLSGTLYVFGASRQAAITASGLVTANAGLTVSGTTNNITATGNNNNSFNVLTANGGGGSYNQMVAGSGSYNYITATTGGQNNIQGPTIFQNTSSTASGVTINNTNGLTVANDLYIGTEVGSGTNLPKSIYFAGHAQDSGYNMTVIESRLYNYPAAGENSELLIYKGNDEVGASGPDRIRLRAGQIAFDTYSASVPSVDSTSRTAENIRMVVNSNGNVGIGLTNPTSTFQVVGTTTLQSTSITSGLTVTSGGLVVAGGTNISGGINLLAAGGVTRATLNLFEVNGGYGFQISNGEELDDFKITAVGGTGAGDKVTITREQTTLVNTSTSITGNISLTNTTITGGLFVSGSGGLNVTNGIVGNIRTAGHAVILASMQPNNTIGFAIGYLNNINNTTYADCIHFNTWSDGTAGVKNLLMLNKGGFGMRIYQAPFTQTTAYTDYRDVVLANQSGNVSISGTLSVTGKIFNNGLDSSYNNLINLIASSQNTNLGSLNVSGATTLSGILNVSGATTISGALNVTANVTSSNTSTGSLRILGGLGVSGNIHAGAMVTAPFFNTVSDRRIKTDITDLNFPSLEIMRKIRPREYTMIDGNKESVYGFIAQEVKEVIPKSIYLRKGYIPSVYENAFVDGTTIKLLNKSTTDISCCKLKLRDQNNDDIIVNVTSIHDNKTFTIDTDISNNIFCMDICGTILYKYIQNGVTTYMRGSQIYAGEVKQGIFVYGSQVDDFHTINKDTIFTVTLSATQEMDSQLQEARHTIRTLEERISAIEKRLS